MILYTFMMFMFQKHETHLIQVLRKLLILYDDDDDDDDYDNVSIQYTDDVYDDATMTRRWWKDDAAGANRTEPSWLSRPSRATLREAPLCF
jgi:hypothetical protein